MTIELYSQTQTLGTTQVIDNLGEYLLINPIPHYSIGVTRVYPDGSTPKPHIRWRKVYKQAVKV